MADSRAMVDFGETSDEETSSDSGSGTDSGSGSEVELEVESADEEDDVTLAVHADEDNGNNNDEAVLLETSAVKIEDVAVASKDDDKDDDDDDDDAPLVNLKSSTKKKSTSKNSSSTQPSNETSTKSVVKEKKILKLNLRMSSPPTEKKKKKQQISSEKNSADNASSKKRKMLLSIKAKKKIKLPNPKKSSADNDDGIDENTTNTDSTTNGGNNSNSAPKGHEEEGIKKEVLTNENEKDKTTTGGTNERTPNLSSQSTNNKPSPSQPSQPEKTEKTSTSKDPATTSTAAVKKSSARPSLAATAVVSEKRILLHAGPAESLPPGWTIKHYKRTTGLKHTDRYWFSPLLKKKFRSLAQVGRFLDFLSREEGDEAKAWDLFRTSPPGPDEIRSNRNRGIVGLSVGGRSSSGGGNVTGGVTSGGGSGGSNGKRRNFLGGGSGSTSGGGSSAFGNGGSYLGGGIGLGSYGSGGSFSSRQFRLAPIPSPGLYMVLPPALLQKNESIENWGITGGDGKDRPVNGEASKSECKPPKLQKNSQGYASPSSVFHNSLHICGYSSKKLNEVKHRGSSFLREVGDMFDSSVILEEIDLISRDLWCRTVEVGIGGSSKDVKKETTENEIRSYKEESQDQFNITSHDKKGKRMVSDIIIDQLSQHLNKRRCKSRKIPLNSTDDCSNESFGDANDNTQFVSMIPKSLTIALPDSYVEARAEYYAKVKKREEMLKKYHKQKRENEKVIDAYEDAKEDWEDKKEELRSEFGKKMVEGKDEDDGEIIKVLGPMPEKPKFPDLIDIPNIPLPPSLTHEDSEFKDSINNRAEGDEVKEENMSIKREDNDNADEKDNLLSKQANGSKATDNNGGSSGTSKSSPSSDNSQWFRGQQKMSCVPESKQYLVAHLDPDCFVLPEGRYYGLISNHIADPQFVGPNAPGISAVSTGSGTGLATSHAGGSANTGTSYSDRYHNSGVGSNGDGSGDKKISYGKNSNALSFSNSSNMNSSKNRSEKSANSRSNKNGNNNRNNYKNKSNTNNTGPTTTGTPIQLKKVMEKGGEAAISMRQSIIRAAVYASRTGAHGGSFIGANGEAYPDVSKAFSNHGNLRPCARCKNNKQGAYHCRLRRKHGERDYDGGNSAEVLVELFDMPMEDLLVGGNGSSNGGGESCGAN